MKEPGKNRTSGDMMPDNNKLDCAQTATSATVAPMRIIRSTEARFPIRLEINVPMTKPVGTIAK